MQAVCTKPLLSYIGPGNKARGVWGELASHKRSLTHCPSSQGWASCVLLQSVYVVLYCLVAGELAGVDLCRSSARD